MFRNLSLLYHDRCSELLRFCAQANTLPHLISTDYLLTLSAHLPDTEVPCPFWFESEFLPTYIHHIFLLGTPHPSRPSTFPLVYFCCMAYCSSPDLHGWSWPYGFLRAHIFSFSHSSLLLHQVQNSWYYRPCTDVHLSLESALMQVFQAWSEPSNNLPVFAMSPCSQFSLGAPCVETAK